MGVQSYKVGMKGTLQLQGARTSSNAIQSGIGIRDISFVDLMEGDREGLAAWSRIACLIVMPCSSPAASLFHEPSKRHLWRHLPPNMDCAFTKLRVPICIRLRER